MCKQIFTILLVLRVLQGKTGQKCEGIMACIDCGTPWIFDDIKKVFKKKDILGKQYFLTKVSYSPELSNNVEELFIFLN